MSSKKMNFIQYSFIKYFVKRKKAEFYLKKLSFQKQFYQRRELPINARPTRL